ncbi:hypothetical protein PQQ99_15500 [Paraburkholderia sediminicola]|uniref:hypothetical protein n=1 Tax=Paraburkholderia sediminicola TaxID=458836 RepID=UPI0038BA60D0
MANKFTVSSAIKVVVILGALVAGLFASPLDHFPLAVRAFIGLVGAVMGALFSLGFLLLHHLAWPKKRKWGMPTWSNGLLSPWQWMHIFSMAILSMSAGEWVALFLRYGWRESTQSLVFFGIGGGMWVGVRLAVFIFKSRIPASSCSKMSA